MPTPDFPPVSVPTLPVPPRRPRSQVLRDIADIHAQVPDVNMIDVNEVRKALAMELPNSIQTVFDFARAALPLWEAIQNPPPKVAKAVERIQTSDAAGITHKDIYGYGAELDVLILGSHYLTIAALATSPGEPNAKT